MTNDIQISQGALLIIGTIVASLVGAISLLFKSLISAKDAQNKQTLDTMTLTNDRLLKEKDQFYDELKKERDALRAMTLTAIADLEMAANVERRKRGLDPLEKVPPVAPQHNSEPTREQIVAAEIATLRIRLTTATLALGLPVRTLASILPANLSADVEKLIEKATSDLDMLTTRPLGYIVTDGSGTIITFSGHLLSMLDWSDSDLIHKNISIITPERLRKKNLDILNKTNNPKKPYLNRVYNKISMLKKDGTEILVNIYLLRWLTDDKHVRFGAYIHEYAVEQPPIREKSLQLAEKDIDEIFKGTT